MGEEGNILYLMLWSITEVLSCQSLPGEGREGDLIWFDLICLFKVGFTYLHFKILWTVQLIKTD